MDEPFGALDPITRRELQDEFRGLQRRLGTTVVLVTHDIREACRLGDRLALLHEGELVQVGAGGRVPSAARPTTTSASSSATRRPWIWPSKELAVLHDWLDLLSSERWALLGATAAHLELVSRPCCSRCSWACRSASWPRAGRCARAGRRRGRRACSRPIPSLALLGFLLIAFRGQIGKPPALAALVLYALLPIVKNTILGLRSIDPGVREAALGAGDDRPGSGSAWSSCPWPCRSCWAGSAWPRSPRSGMATIAAAIGASGLGSYIFRGVALSDTRLILLGSVPAALLALACDAALGELERLLDPTRPRHSRLRGCIAALAVGLLARPRRPGAGGSTTGRAARTGPRSRSARRTAAR